MARFSPGDQVFCNIRNNEIINVYEEVFDCTQVFDIIAAYAESYVLYVSYDCYLKDTIYIDNSNIEKYRLHKKFLDSNIYIISEYQVSGISKKIDGMSCCKCGEFFPMAKSNRMNETLVCWNCSKYPFYK
jgi:hypothetical protein